MKKDQQRIVQAEAILTVSESKRLIAKAVARMSIVKQALKSGMVIIARGTTNTYVAEEILRRKISKGAFVTGRVYPAKGGMRIKSPAEQLAEIVIRDGKAAKGVSLEDALGKLNPGDVVIKGANLLDYGNKTAGVLIGHPESGTIGKIMPYVVARKAHLVIPIGLEKAAAGNAVEISNMLREPVESVGGQVCSMLAVTGHIITEIEALDILADVSAFQAGAGGIGGAEGAVRLVFRGTTENVEAALKLIESIQGEPPFVE